MPALIYRRCKKHETRLKYRHPYLQVFYNHRQIAVFKFKDVMDLIVGTITKTHKQPKLVKECEDEPK